MNCLQYGSLPLDALQPTLPNKITPDASFIPLDHQHTTSPSKPLICIISQTILKQTQTAINLLIQFTIKIMKMKTSYLSHNDRDCQSFKPNKKTYPARQHENGHHNHHEAAHPYDSKHPPIKRQNQRYGKMQREETSKESKLEFHNAEKLKHIEKIKASNIDDLNIKIQKMISKLSQEVSPYSSNICLNQASKMRLKTDYTGFTSTHYGSIQNDSQVIFDHFHQVDKKKMAQSEIISDQQVFQERKIQKINVDHIRRKYKERPQTNSKKGMKHQKSMTTLSNHSQIQQNSQVSNTFYAEMIRFKQKLKENTQKDRRQLSREINFSTNKQKESKVIKATPKKNIDEQMKKYQQRLNTYNSKKLLGLANQGQIQRIPLGDKTNSVNSYLKYSPYSSKVTPELKSNFKLKIKQEETSSFHPEVDTFQQHQEPLTADFRQLSDKNQLKFFLKNLTNQISLDEEFRNCKKWFQKLNKPSKWEQLESQLEYTNLNLDENSIHQIFTLTTQEENPFYTPRECQFDILSMVELFIKCEEHWFDNIVKKYSRERLLQSGFKSSKIDISGKGHLTIEDFVRFVNMEMDLSIRNRDLQIIFQRLKSEDYLTFEDLMDVICS